MDYAESKFLLSQNTLNYFSQIIEFVIKWFKI